MLASYGYVGLLFIVAVLFPSIMLLLSFLLGLVRIRPHKPDPVKSSTYECGNVPIGDSWVQFNFRYYFYALLFVIFDVLAVFLLPWAVAFKRLDFAFIEMTIFILILLVGYVYAWRKKVLEWK